MTTKKAQAELQHWAFWNWNHRRVDARWYPPGAAFILCLGMGADLDTRDVELDEIPPVRVMSLSNPGPLHSLGLLLCLPLPCAFTPTSQCPLWGKTEGAFYRMSLEIILICLPPVGCLVCPSTLHSPPGHSYLINYLRNNAYVKVCFWVNPI